MFGADRAGSAVFDFKGVMKFIFLCLVVVNCPRQAAARFLEPIWRVHQGKMANQFPERIFKPDGTGDLSLCGHVHCHWLW